MLDVHTLQKCVNWLQARQIQICGMENEPIINAKREMLSDLIHELSSKTLDIELAMKESQMQDKKTCVYCGGKRTKYQVNFSKVHLRILKKIFVYCIENKTHEINKIDIPGLTHTDYGNFCFLQRFGLLYYLMDDKGRKVKGGKWGVAVKRIYEFLNGGYAIAAYTTRDTKDKTNQSSEEKIYVHEIKNYTESEQQADKENALPYFVRYLEIEQDI